MPEIECKACQPGGFERLRSGFCQDLGVCPMVTTVERFRKPVSWVSGMIAVFMIIFSSPKSADSLFYEFAEIIGLAFIIIATLGRIWSSLHIVGSKNSVLCDIGPYSACRNPLYVFSFIGMMGLFMVSDALILLPPFALLFAVYYSLVVKAEENRLVALFGQSFREYCSRTPRFWPQFANYRPGGEVTINLVVFYKRIIDSMWFLWIFLGMRVLEMVKHAHFGGHGIIPILVHPPF